MTIETKTIRFTDAFVLQDASHPGSSWVPVSGSLVDSVFNGNPVRVTMNPFAPTQSPSSLLVCSNAGVPANEIPASSILHGYALRMTRLFETATNNTGMDTQVSFYNNGIIGNNLASSGNWPSVATERTYGGMNNFWDHGLILDTIRNSASWGIAIAAGFPVTAVQNSNDIFYVSGIELDIFYEETTPNGGGDPPPESFDKMTHARVFEWMMQELKSVSALVQRLPNSTFDIRPEFPNELSKTGVYIRVNDEQAEESFSDAISMDILVVSIGEEHQSRMNCIDIMTDIYHHMHRPTNRNFSQKSLSTWIVNPRDYYVRIKSAQVESMVPATKQDGTNTTAFQGVLRLFIRANSM